MNGGILGPMWAAWSAEGATCVHRPLCAIIRHAIESRPLLTIKKQKPTSLKTEFDREDVPRQEWRSTWDEFLMPCESAKQPHRNRKTPMGL